MKNKNKSSKVQAYIRQVEQSAKSANHKSLEQERQRAEAKAAAKKAKEEAALFGNLFVAKPKKKVEKKPEEVDPKTQICEDFMAGRCSLGDKCKFSHDASNERKLAKRNIYEDPREQDTMDQWDQAKLEEVVATRQKQRGGLPSTDIVCKYFLDAIEKNNYGWFWECPTGAKCHYRHALPPGYVFQPKRKAAEQGQEVDIGELIEERRRLLDISKCTPVTEESFREWKERRQKLIAERLEKERLEAAKNKKENTSRLAAGMSGRALFTFNPTLFEDDEGAVADDDMLKQVRGANEDEAEEEAQEVLYGNDNDPIEEEEEEEEDDGVVADPEAAESKTEAKAEKAEKAEKKDKKDKKDKKEKKDKKGELSPDAAVQDADLFLDDDEELPE